MYVKIKMCGITRHQDIKVGISLGVDAFGFVFIKDNPRYINPQEVFEITKTLPPLITKVGVFANASLEEIDEAVKISGVDTVQLNGNEPPEYAELIRIPVIKKFALDFTFDLTCLNNYSVSAFLLDTWSAHASRYEGLKFSWNIAKNAVGMKKHIILAGRLGLTNIREALDEVQPYGVDVNSGVEVSPGVKNPQKIAAVVKAVREWK